MKGTLYLIPVPLAETAANEVLPVSVLHQVQRLQTFIVENSKAARRHIKMMVPEKVQADLKLFELNKHTEESELYSFIKPLLEGEDMGLLSDAGCPGVADPGAKIVALAHENGIKVVPMVGPSSILLAMMASGMNGQSFVFHGYIPIDKKDRKNFIKQMERISYEQNQAQLFIETPYRNNQLLDDLFQTLQPHTRLSIGANLTHPDELMQTKTIAQWKKNKPQLHKIPTIFILQKSK